MLTFVDDLQTVGEVSSTVFGAIQQGATNAQFILKNVGVNIISYTFQYKNGTTWTDIGEEGTVYNSTLAEDEQVSLTISDIPPQIRLIADASGGSVLSFSCTRYFNWTTGGYLPLMSA